MASLSCLKSHYPSTPHPLDIERVTRRSAKAVPFHISHLKAVRRPYSDAAATIKLPHSISVASSNSRHGKSARLLILIRLAESTHTPAPAAAANIESCHLQNLVLDLHTPITAAHKNRVPLNVVFNTSYQFLYFWLTESDPTSLRMSLVWAMCLPVTTERVGVTPNIHRLSFYITKNLRVAG